MWVRVMVQTPNRILTLDEFLQMPETKPASEFIDGRIFQKPMPQGKHSIIQGGIVKFVDHHLSPSKIARAFPELRCTFGNRSIVPDVAIFTWERIPRDPSRAVANAFPIAPDWTVEILSLAQSPTYVIRNILYCLQQGAKLGWLIDPEASVVMIYTPDQHLELLEDPNVYLPMPSFAQDLRLRLGEVFEWLLE